MAFRADEAARAGYEEVEAAFVSPRIGASERARSKAALKKLSEELGPVVDSYPTWHPLVTHAERKRHPQTTPNGRCGYRGLDHTRYFAHGFITCPYGDGQEVIDSVNALPRHPAAEISAERLKVQLHDPRATPILVRCHWVDDLESDLTIPLRIAIALILEKEVPAWQWADAAETWETMRPYFLGKPHGSRSSLFVSQETGQAIKTVWNTLIGTGIFGPIYE